MSTYYRLRCETCQEMTPMVAFTRQMWGWGNADCVAVLKFVMAHTRDHELGPTFRVLSEYDEEYLPANDQERKHAAKQFLDRTTDIFPHDNYWVEDVKTRWDADFTRVYGARLEGP